MIMDRSQPLPEGSQQGLARWWLSWTLGTVCFLTSVYYLIFHLLIGIPLRFLSLPAAIRLATAALIGPLFFEARKRSKSSNGQKYGMFYGCFALYTLCGLLCWAYLGIRASVIPREDAPVVYTIVCFVSLGGPLGSYFLKKFTVPKSS
jgi:hypothetical protein